jgi:RimJ/RimL family protein N-acetyltransferase
MNQGRASARGAWIRRARSRSISCVGVRKILWSAAAGRGILAPMSAAGAFPVRLPTALEGVELRELTVDDADEYFALVQRSAVHLTARGDYRDEVAATHADVVAMLATRTELPLRFGVFDGGALVGRVDLVPVDPPRFGLGYWLGEGVTGRGIATNAVGALLDHARTVLGATDIFAGITHGNVASEAVVTRLGFARVADFESYSRWHRALQGDIARQALPRFRSGL